MKMYIQFYRLYFLWFTLASLCIIWLLISSGDMLPSLFIKLVLYLPVYVLVLPSLKKHSCYFQNQGQSVNGMYLRVAALDFVGVTTICLIINLIMHA